MTAPGMPARESEWKDTPETLGVPPELLALRSAAAVRERCQDVRDHVAAGRSPWFSLDERRLAVVATDVADVTRRAYPDLAVPYHSRWRHFTAGGVDRWGAIAAAFSDPRERGRAAIDLATVSVLLDAGAGSAWRWREPATGQILLRSEGLGVASFSMFRDGLFSSDPSVPWRVDAAALARLTEADLTEGFQVSGKNPLVGVAARTALLNRLGAALSARPELFGTRPPRPGNLLDHVIATYGGRVAAPELLALLLDGFSSIWPSGLSLDGFALGDAGRHPAVTTGDRSRGVVPFHKLSQWLAWSLLEPFESAGVAVTDLDGLTALAEYRNGGLLIDHGVILPKPALDLSAAHPVGSEPVVEWRALTVALIDRLLPLVRRELGRGDDFTLGHVLEGGTWAAGRRIAAKLRPPDGTPPLVIAADGTVF